MTDAGTTRQEIATAGKARLAMTGWWTDCGRKVVVTTLFGQKGYPFRSVYRGSADAKIESFLGWGNVCCTHNSARLEGSGEVALIAGAVNSNPPQPASLVSFLPEQERYPPEELHLQIPQRVSFSTQKAPPNDIGFIATLRPGNTFVLPGRSVLDSQTVWLFSRQGGPFAQSSPFITEAYPRASRIFSSNRSAGSRAMPSSSLSTISR